MLLNTPLPFVKTFVDELDNGLRAHEPGKGLSSTQRKWLGFCLMVILLTNSVSSRITNSYNGNEDTDLK